MKERVLDTIRSLNISRQKVLLAVSGGPDSMALFHLMAELQEELQTELHIAHLNHGLRPSAGAEAEFVCALAESFGFPFYLRSVVVAELAAEEKIGEELAGRLARYRFFAEIQAQTGALLMTGHHKDDQIETILMHILRGAGLRGLVGMQPDGEVLRPLLGVSKAEILRFLEAEGIPWMLDESNLEPGYFRNRLRHELLPMLRTLQPGAEDALLTLSLNASDALEIVADQTDAFLDKALRSGDEILFSAAAFLQAKPSLQRAIIRAIVLLLNGNETDLTRAQTEEIRAVYHGTSGRRIELSGLLFTVTQQGLVAARIANASGFSLMLPESGELIFPGGKLRIYDAVTTDALLRMKDRLALPRGAGRGLLLRTRLPDDRIRLFGTGGEKSLARAMKDLKIRHDLRDGWPLICHGSQVYWIAGEQKSEETRLEAGVPATVYQYICEGDDDARVQ